MEYFIYWASQDINGKGCHWNLHKGLFWRIFKTPCALVHHMAYLPEAGFDPR